MKTERKPFIRTPSDDSVTVAALYERHRRCTVGHSVVHATNLDSAPPMQKIGTTTLHDANDAAYTFDAYPLDADFEEAGAVYAVTRRRQADDGSFAYDPVYIGQTDDLSRHFSNHPRRGCFRKYDADTVCIFADAEKTTREEIETALIQRYDAPCNHAD